MEPRSLRIGLECMEPLLNEEVRSLLDSASDWCVTLVQPRRPSDPLPDPSACDLILCGNSDPAWLDASASDDPPRIVLTPDREEEALSTILQAGAWEVIPHAELDLPRLIRTVIRTAERVEVRRITQERTRALESENALLLRQRRELQAFHHLLSHELRTPLTSVREFVSLIADGIAGPVNETQREFLHRCLDGCDQLKRYTEDLLDLSRLDTGKLSLRAEPIDLGRVIDDLIAAEAPLARKRGVELVHPDEREDEAPPFLVEADAARLRQILSNLVDNALRHARPGGTVTISVEESPDDSPEAREFIVSVCDDGPGIGTADPEELFLRHRQGSDGGGLGLGLGLCRDLVELHGGSIRLESPASGGCRVQFTLPRPRELTAPREELTT